MKKLVYICLLTICCAQTNAAPFWKTKAKVYQRIQNREVIVSVRSTSDSSPPLHTLHVEGGGQVRAPRDFVFGMAQKYDELAKMSDYITRSNYNVETHVLDLRIEAFSHTADMQVELKAFAEEEPLRIAYRIVSGPLQGYAGSVTFAAVNAGKSEVGISGEYKYDQFPIPRFFLQFGLEVVMQKMAWRLRSSVEEKWHSQHP